MSGPLKWRLFLITYLPSPYPGSLSKFCAQPDRKRGARDERCL